MGGLTFDVREEMSEGILSANFLAFVNLLPVTLDSFDDGVWRYCERCMLVRPRRRSYAVDVRMWTSLSLFLPSLLVAQERLHDDMSHGRGHRDTLSIGRMPRLHDACCPSHNNKRLTCNPLPT